MFFEEKKISFKYFFGIAEKKLYTKNVRLPYEKQLQN